MSLSLDDITEDLYCCLQCGYCLSICPAFEQFGWESSSPRGKLFYLKKLKEKNFLDKLLRRKIELNDEIFQRLYHCTSCGACNEVCQVNINLTDLWEDLKERMIKEGLKPILAHKELYTRISNPNKRNPFSDEKDPERDTLAKRTAWLPKDIILSFNPEVIFFVGCTSSYRLDALAKTTAKLLASACVPFSILGVDEWCCGSPLLRTGQTDIIKKEYAKHNVDMIKKTGAKAVVTACAGCYATLKNDYPKILGEIPFKVYHLAEYLNEMIKSGSIKFNKKLDMKVTYHDPCHLGRHAGVFEEPREVIKSIHGVTLVEMARNREASRCCGAGGGFKIAFNEKAENIAAERVREAQAIGAELIVTPCPFCVVNLNAGAKKANIPIKTIDLLQFIDMAL